MSGTTTSTPLTALLVDYSAVAQATKEVRRQPCQSSPGRDRCEKPILAALLVPLQPGETYTLRWQLHATDYVFPAGDRIGLVIVANDSDYTTPDPASGGVSIGLSGSSLTIPLADH